MKSIKNILGGLAIIGGLIALSGFIHAQVTTAPVQSVSGSTGQPDSVVQIAADSQGLALVPSDQLPRVGTFWTVGSGGLCPVPYPCPVNDPNAIFYAIGPSGVFLVDATDGAVLQPSGRQAMLGVSSATLIQEQLDSVLNLIGQVQGMQANEQATATMSASGAMSPMGVPFPGVGGSDSSTNGDGGGASPDGSPAQDYGTNLWIAQVNISSNNLTGIASNTVADIQYEIQSLTDLTQTNWVSQGFILGSETTNWTPLNALAVSLTNNFFIRLRSWASSDGSGLPDWWELEYFGHTGVDPFGDPEGDGWDNLQKFENGMNPFVFYASPAPPDTNTPPPTLTLVSGPQGYFYVIGSGLPSDLSAIRIFRYSEQYTSGGVNYWPDGSGSGYPTDLADGSFDLPVASITNGIAQIPASEAYSFGNYAFEAAAIDSNGVASATNYLGSFFNSVFVDGRAQLKDNVRFLLRAASESIPFEVDETIEPTNYVYSGLYDSSVKFDPLAPFENNYFYRNFDFDVNNMIITNFGYIPDGGGDYVAMGMPEGVYFGSGWGENYSLGTYTGAILNYTGNLTYAVDFPSFITTNSIVAPSSWNVSQSNWLFPAVANDFFDGFPASQNLFGLSYLSEISPYYTNNTFLTETYYPTAPPSNPPGGFYFRTTQPGFETVGYYFARAGIDPMPEQGTYSALSSPTAFSTTNTTPLLIAGVGQSMPQLAGYAKLAVTNGYSGMYAYLGQYFTNAYEINTNGVVPTNSAGILSPYGNFFATEPGPAALVTMPDIDTGAQGTCTVYCVSLQLDKNHDGTMDMSFNGPDTTSQASPMEFWVNDGHDQAGVNGNLDTDLEVPPASMNYSINGITCQRDLENFARLWVCGMPQLPTSQGYTVTLSMSAVSGSPAINLYDSVETNGGIGYLTDTNIAYQQCLAYAHGSSPYGIYFTGPGAAIAQITPAAPFTFPTTYFTNGGNTYFLFEGAGIGSGQLTLTISQNGNWIAQTSAYLDLHDIKDFYEQAVITNNTSGAISNWSSTIEKEQPATSSALVNDTNLIVFVHGINVDDWYWLDDSDTVFKRLYWAGYRGKFTTVKWPCDFLTPPQPFVISVFNQSELQAYKASMALTTYLNQLRTRFPGYRLNLLVHSQGNAVVSEAIEQGVPFDTYILTQGALPANSYDVNAPTDAAITNYDTGSNITPEWQPMGYHGVYTNLTGSMVNFYNPQDAALSDWIYDQEHIKPSPGYFYDGTNCWNNSLGYDILVTDPQESRSMISRSRTDPIGRQGPVSGQTTQGVIGSAINLNAQFGFNGSTFDEHSAQWTRPIQTCWGYYDQILESCLIPAIQR